MKLSYLPEAHTDFIFPMVGEELGLWGVLGTVGAFVVLLFAGMCISSYAPNRFGKLLGFGLTFLLSLEALLNMGVTTALLPNKGLPLPFVSYGGSSLLAAMVVVGILINIHRQGVHLTWDQLPVIRRKRRWTPQL
jgi:cell division protein FtsW